MRQFFSAAAFAIAATTAGSAALAFPVPSQPRLASSVIEVQDLCGLGWHQGPDGMCYLNGFPSAYRPYAADASPYYHHAGRCWRTDSVYGARRVCVW
jgi:hypothetical protein